MQPDRLEIAKGLDSAELYPGEGVMIICEEGWEKGKLGEGRRFYVHACIPGKGARLFHPF